MENVEKKEVSVEFPNVFMIPQENGTISIRSEIKIPESLADLIKNGHAKDKIQRLIRKGLKGLNMEILKDGENDTWYSSLSIPTDKVMSLKETIDISMSIHTLHHNVLDLIVGSSVIGNIIADIKPFTING